MKVETKLIIINVLMIGIVAASVTLINEYYRGKAVTNLNAHSDAGHDIIIEGQNVRSLERTNEHQLMVDNSNNNTWFIIEEIRKLGNVSR